MLQRPVEWLLWSPSTETGVIVIPEELELLLPTLQHSQRVHLIAYAAPVTRTMLDFSCLRFFSFPELPGHCEMPSWLAVEVGILAGRLYMGYGEARHLEHYIKSPSSTALCTDPAGFLLKWLPLRRTGQDITHTPAAYVCQGRPLQQSHAFFVQPEVVNSEDVENEEGGNGNSENDGDVENRNDA